MDFAIALLLFIFTLVVYFSYASNFQKQEKGDLGEMLADAKAISSSLALSGYPTNWDNTTVIRIGIADEQKINVIKIKYFKQLNYSKTKTYFGTFYDYFVFFVNDKGEVLNINGFCGTGQPLIDVSYDIKSAYYYSSEDDKFLKDFMSNTFKADVYFGDNPSNLDDIDSLISNISKYGFLVMEHPAFDTGKFENIYKEPLNYYSSRGGFTMLSGQLVSGQKKELFGVSFSKEKGQSISDRNSTVNTTDPYLALTIGENIVFRQSYDVANDTSSALPALELTTIASFNKDNTNAIAKWKYSNGTVYFLSDFDVSFFSGDFIKIIEDLAKSLIEGTCYPINVTGISKNKLVKAERYLNYNSKIIKMVVYVWQ
ncbi:hypothetical protein J4234_05655 [Candidatus Woesearchaeota archaeon]|nr:hypothetical protein [Candidatus Woesearchaeota archaeon]